MPPAQNATSTQDFDCDPLVALSHHELSREATPVGGATSFFLGKDSAAVKITCRRPSIDSFAPGEVIPLEPTSEASVARRILQVATAVVLCAVASGIMFGFAAIKPILISEGIYSDLCTAAVGEDPIGTGTVPRVPCVEQDLRLNFWLIAGSVSANTSCLPAGWILDRYGRRACFILAALILAAAGIVMGLAFAVSAFDGYLLGSIMFSLGGTFIFVPSFELAAAFPRHSGLVVAMVTGSFDASAAVFLFYRMAWEATGGALTPARFFFGYAAAVPPLILLTEWLYMPPKADPYRLAVVPEDPERRRLAKIDDRAAEPLLRGEADEKEEEEEAGRTWTTLHNLPAHRQMLTVWFGLVMVLTVVQMLRMNFMIATIRAQYRYMLSGNEAAAAAINAFFDVALPVGGIVSTPMIGMLLSRASVGRTWAAVAVFTAVVGICNCLPFEWAGYVTVVGFVLFRPLYYSAVSDFATKVFGFASFGRIYGTITCVAGLMQLGQSGLDRLVHGPLREDPTAVNAALAVLATALGAALGWYAVVQERKKRADTDPGRRQLPKGGGVGEIEGRDCEGYGAI